MIGKPIGTTIKIIDTPSRTKPAKKTSVKIRIKVHHLPNSQSFKIPRTASKPPDDKKTLAKIAPPTTIFSIIAVTESVLIIASNIIDSVNVL